MTTRDGKRWHIGLWVLQALLAVAFGMAGVMKLGTSITMILPESDVKPERGSQTTRSCLVAERRAERVVIGRG